MKIYLIVSAVLFGLVALPCIAYFIAYLWTGIDTCKDRALAFYRWSALVFMVTLNVVVYREVLEGIRAVFFRANG